MHCSHEATAPDSRPGMAWRGGLELSEELVFHTGCWGELGFLSDSQVGSGWMRFYGGSFCPDSHPSVIVSHCLPSSSGLSCLVLAFCVCLCTVTHLLCNIYLPLLVGPCHLPCILIWISLYLSLRSFRLARCLPRCLGSMLPWWAVTTLDSPTSGA